MRRGLHRALVAIGRATALLSVVMATWIGSGCKRRALGVGDGAGTLGDGGPDVVIGNDAGPAADGPADGGGQPDAADAADGGCLVHPLDVADCGCGARWLRSYDPGTEDGAGGLTTSASGDVIVAGWTRARMNASTDAWVRKYDAQGTEIWTRTFDLGGDDRAAGVAVDRSGNVIVTGSTGADGWLRKYDGTGAEVWTLRVAGARDAVAADDGGNVLVAGPSVGASKYDPAGALLWTWPPAALNLAQNWTTGIAVDSGGNVVVAGSVRQDDGAIGTENWRTDIYVRRLDPAGTELWTRTYDGGRDDWGYAVAVDAQRNVIVAGRSYLRPANAAFSYHGWLRKYDAAGGELWTRAEAGAGPRELGNRVAVDAAGNVFVTWLGIWTYDGQGTPGGRDPCRADLLAIDGAGRRALAGNVARPTNTFESLVDVWVGSYLR